MAEDLPGRRLRREMEDAAEDALRRIAFDLQARAVALAPLEEGTLRASAHVEVERTPRGVEAEVSFNTPYALAQHEGAPGPPASWAGKTELTYTTPGTGSKYLENPLTEMAVRYEATLGAAVRARIGT